MKSDDADVGWVPNRECVVCGTNIPQPFHSAPRKICEVCSRRQRNARYKVYAYIPETAVTTRARQEPSAKLEQRHSSHNQLSFDFGSDFSKKLRQPHHDSGMATNTIKSPLKISALNDGRNIGLSFGPCPKCGSATVLKEHPRTYATFLGCSDYPNCRWQG